MIKNASPISGITYDAAEIIRSITEGDVCLAYDIDFSPKEADA